MTLKVCLAGATGWVGTSLAPAIAKAENLSLTGGVSRTHAGQDVGTVLGAAGLKAPLFATVAEALAARACDVLVDYTHPRAVKGHVLAAVAKGVHVVVGTSGLNEDDYAEIDAVARQNKVGVLAAGNFAMTAVLLNHFAAIAAKHIPSWEIIDYAGAAKPDAPSGTARELAARLAREGPPVVGHPVAETMGPRESRGATFGGTQVHAVRLPGYVLAAEVIFGAQDEKLVLRHEAGSSAEPYVAGTLLAIRKVGDQRGLVRGLDQVLNL